MSNEERRKRNRIGFRACLDERTGNLSGSHRAYSREKSREYEYHAREYRGGSTHVRERTKYHDKDRVEAMEEKRCRSLFVCVSLLLS